MCMIKTSEKIPTQTLAALSGPETRNNTVWEEGGLAPFSLSLIRATAWQSVPPSPNTK